MKVVVIETGVANTASVLAALTRAGLDASLTTDPGEVRDGSGVVLPGVGSFGAGMQALRARGLVETVLDRIRSDRPFLAVCLGMQLLCQSSDESPGEHGLSVIDAHIERFPATLRVPQFGWNQVRADATCSMLTSGYAYFANSYRLVSMPEGWKGAISSHGGDFVAAIERGNTLACQFHPELSGPWGIELLTRWAERTRKVVPTC